MASGTRRSRSRTPQSWTRSPARRQGSARPAASLPAGCPCQAWVANEIKGVWGKAKVVPGVVAFNHGPSALSHGELHLLRQVRDGARLAATTPTTTTTSTRSWWTRRTASGAKRSKSLGRRSARAGRGVLGLVQRARLVRGRRVIQRRLRSRARIRREREGRRLAQGGESGQPRHLRRGGLGLLHQDRRLHRRRVLRRRLRCRAGVHGRAEERGLERRGRGAGHGGAQPRRRSCSGWSISCLGAGSCTAGGNYPDQTGVSQAFVTSP